MTGKPFDYWDFFTSEAKRADSPLYVRLSEGVRDNPELRAFAAQAKKGQPHANILFGAVHYLLLRGADHPLRAFYPNLNGGTRIEGDPFPHFIDFAGRHRDALASLIASKVTNTNEVGRSSLLHAAFRAVAEDGGEPLNLIEIGPSAGLNLIWNRYGVRYHRGGETFELPVKNPALIIDCELRGERNPPLGPTPEIASRVGLELNPVNLDDPTQRDWLRALVWPDTRGRFERLEAALKAYASDRPEIRIGSALDLLPDALRAIPEDRRVCVYHSYAVYQFSREMKEALESLLTLAGLRRPIWRIGIEGGLDGSNTIEMTCYHDGIRDAQTLALCHPHGAWLDWRR
ncbi:MAG: DUF2332 domain-containing protein [Proteobacteria bacterium]|nr:DUF2332 domain-containing protein [Pseudomonadota bacterium]